jgi:hypothetical protein
MYLFNFKKHDTKFGSALLQTHENESLNQNEKRTPLEMNYIAKITSIACTDLHDRGLNHTTPQFICGAMFLLL